MLMNPVALTSPFYSKLSCLLVLSLYWIPDFDTKLVRVLILETSRWQLGWSPLVVCWFFFLHSCLAEQRSSGNAQCLLAAPHVTSTYHQYAIEVIRCWFFFCIQKYQYIGNLISVLLHSFWIGPPLTSHQCNPRRIQPELNSTVWCCCRKFCSFAMLQDAALRWEATVDILLWILQICAKFPLTL